MRKSIFVAVAVIGLAVSVVLAGAGKIQPLKAKTGLWQITQTITWTGLSPQMEAMMKFGVPMTYKSCVKPKDLGTNPWAEGSGVNCTWTVLTSNGTDMEVQGTSCQLGNDEYSAIADFHGNIHMLDPEHGTGSESGSLTFNGQTIHGHASYTGKWIAATCPAAASVR